LACVLWPSPSWSQLFSQQFDSEIEAAVAHWWSPDPAAPDWRAWKAQLYQESRLDPQAVSPVGARGLAQFMPATWAEVSKALGWRNVSAHSPRHAIFAGAYYMRQLRRFPDWRQAPEPDRQQLAQAAYNAGAGNIRKALRRCGGVATWSNAAACLPAVTGKHARETLTYVDRIARWRNLMRGP
jgi:soluble lytic murein transglycosylase-like protein